MNEIKSIQWNHWDRGVRERVGILGSAGEGIGLDPSEHCRVSCLLCCLQRIFVHYIPLCFFHFLLDARQQRYRISSNVLNPNLDSIFWCWSVHSLVHKRWYRRMVKHWAFSLKVWGPSLVHHCHASAFSSSWCVMIASETWGGQTFDDFILAKLTSMKQPITTKWFLAMYTIQEYIMSSHNEQVWNEQALHASWI